VVVGTAGFDLDNTDWYPKRWSLYRLYAFGYGKINIHTDEAKQEASLTWQFVLNSNGTVVDQVVINKKL
jgi:hypothetical protein